MEARLNYVLLGVFFVVSLIALAGFVFWMGKYDRNLKDYHEYYLYNKNLPKGIRTESNDCVCCANSRTLPSKNIF